MTSTNKAVFTRLATMADLANIAPLFNAYRQFYEQADDLALATAFIQERLTNAESVIILALDDAQTGGTLAVQQHGRPQKGGHGTAGHAREYCAGLRFSAYMGEGFVRCPQVPAGSTRGRTFSPAQQLPPQVSTTLPRDAI